MRRHFGITLLEMTTVLVALVVVAAVAIPLWHTQQLRKQRRDAIDALLAVQSAQDRYFGAEARYADDALLHAGKPAGLDIKPGSKLGFYDIDVQRSADGLGYVARARAAKNQGRPDARCAEIRLDQHGRRSASNEAGEDTTADCWAKH